MKSTFIKYLVAGFLLLALWAPQVQDGLQIFKGGELNGAFTKPDDIVFSFENWFNGTFALKKEEFLRTSFGFQGDMVRLHNQIDYTLLREVNANGVVLGKDDYLYEQAYIDSYYGEDFAGHEEIKKRAAMLKELQDTLQNHGIFLFIAFAPGKGSFYPEYIPDNHKPAKKGITNYEVCIESCKREGLNFIDLRRYFLDMKDTSGYRLYPRRGIHWSNYGDVLAFDTIVHYLRQKSGFKMPELKIDSIQVTTHPRSRDNDAGLSLNLIERFDRDTLAYPFFSATDTNRILNFMAIGDSYYWNMQLFNSPLIFKNSLFWYYYDNIYSNDLPVILNKEAHARLKEFILKQNIICIMQTDAGLSNLGFAFPEQANAMFKQQK